jgi:hypothetical protein
MIVKVRPPRTRFLHAEGLESRQLLNAHLPGSPAASVSAESVKLPGVIHATLSGPSTYTIDPLNDNVGSDFYSATGRDTLGPETLTGQDDYVQKLTKKNIYQDTYTDGSLTITGTQGTFSVTYTGSGSQVGLGKYVENFKGTAVGTSGLVNGKYATIIGSITGDDSSTAPAIFKYTLKFITPPKVVSGSVGITGSYTLNPTNPALGSVTLLGSSTATTVTLQDSFSEVEIPNNNYLDVYDSGTMTLVGSSGTFEITYAGSGKSYANGKFAESLSGTAIGTSGPVNGLVSVFKGSVLGSYSSDGSESGKLTFKIQN